MKYLLNVKIEPSKHYIHVKGKIENAISNTFYLNENFHMLYAKADNVDIGFKMDIVDHILHSMLYQDQ